MGTMPANLTPQYLAAEKRFKEAITPQEKIEALEEMMATIPKHKGTEKMRADLRRRMARLNAEKDKKTASSKAGAFCTVPREGAGQVALAGAPNAGKSSLLARLTHASPEIADYPFTTQVPQPGMMPFENIQIQVVDMPPISREFYKPWMGSILRHADLVLLVTDLSSDDLLDEAETVLDIMEGSGIRLSGRTPPAVSGESPGKALCRTLMVANKSDVPQAEDALAILREFYEARFEIFAVSAQSGSGLNLLQRMIFERLDVVRVHTKAPGKKIDLSTTPFVLKSGSTVLDVAKAVHRDFVHTLKYARIWSPEHSKRTLKHDGQMVERTYRLEDGDILELHV
jgi:ribosome-interacting GTPase 1